ncbi:unnamed protein product, partial [Mesorhabditis spiculigera]
MSRDLPPRSKEESTFATQTDVRREIKQELLENDVRNGHRKGIDERIDHHGAVDVQTGSNPFEETRRVEKKKMATKLELAKIDSDMARTRSAMRETKSDMARMQANIALLETISETRNTENRRLKQQNDQNPESTFVTQADVQREIKQELPENDVRNGHRKGIEERIDHNGVVDVQTSSNPIEETRRVEKKKMTMKLELAKIDSDMARTRSAMRETKSDMARMQANIALLETISETRNTENRRLKQQNDQEEEGDDGTKAICKECNHAMCRNDAFVLAQHSTTHITFQPYDCSVCPFTAKLKMVLKRHLNAKHRGSGEIFDNRTAEYFDALEAKTNANFPGHSAAITKYIEGQKNVSGIQDDFDHEDDHQQDNRQVAGLLASDEKENVPTRTEASPSIPATPLIKQEWEPIAEPQSKKKNAAPTLPLQRDVKQEMLEIDVDEGVVEAAIPIEQHVKQNLPINRNLIELGANNNNPAEEVVMAPQPSNERPDARLRATLMNFKFKFAKLQADMLGMQPDMALMEDVAAAGSAENERLKQELGEEISRLKRENDKKDKQIRLLRHEVAVLKDELGIE